MPIVTDIRDKAMHTDPIEQIARRERERREKAKHDPTEAAAMESERLAKRAEIKRKIAAAKVAEKRHQELTSAISKIEMACDDLARTHEQKVHPWKQSIAAIDAEEVEATILGDDLDTGLRQERESLRSQVQSATTELEKQVEEKHKLLRTLHVERNGLAAAISDSSLQGKLLELGRADWLLELRIAKRKVAFAEARRRDCENSRGRWPDEFYQGERQAAGEALAEAQVESEKIVEKIVSE